MQHRKARAYHVGMIGTVLALACLLLQVGAATAAAAQAGPVRPAVVSIPTSVTVTPSANPSIYGPTGFTIVVTTLDGQPVPFGQFMVDATGYGCQGPWSTLPTDGNGTAVQTFYLPVGDSPVKACYQDPTGTYASSESATFIEHVNPRPTTTTLTSSANPSHPGQSVTYTVTIGGYIGGSMYAGTVDFTDVTDSQRPVVLCAAVRFDFGDGMQEEPKATCTQQPAAGAHIIKARFSGTVAYTPSSATLIQRVPSPPPPAPVIVHPADGSTMRDTTPLISGTGEVGDTVTVTIDGVAAGTVTVGAVASRVSGFLAAVAPDGTWSVTAPELSYTSHTIAAYQTNLAGTDSPVATSTFRVVSAPATTSSAAPSSSDTSSPTNTAPPTDTSSPTSTASPTETSSPTSRPAPAGAATPTDGDPGNTLAATGTPGLAGLLAVGIAAILFGAGLLWRRPRQRRRA